MLLTTQISDSSTLNDPAEKKEELGKALGRLASGVYVVTWHNGESPRGLLATWVAQAAFEPPMVTVSINKQRELAALIAPDQNITINVLAKQNMDIFKAFAKPSTGAEQDRFAGLDVNDKSDFGPVFNNSVSYLNCRVDKVMEAGDHLVALCEVVEGRPLNADAEPMTHLRKSGFQY